VLSALACALVLWLLSKGGGIGGLFADGLVISFLFRVTVSTARGADDFRGAEDFGGFFEDVLGPLFRALVASIWSWGPFIAFVIWKRGGFFANGDPLQLREVDGPIPVVILLAGTLLFPMSLLAAALESPLVQLLNPLVIIGYAIRLGRDYLRVSLFCLAVSLAESALLKLLGLIDAHVLGLPEVVQVTALLYPPLMMFRALGLLVRARGDELGYGGAAAYLLPVLGSTRPETELLAPEHGGPPPPNRDAPLPPEGDGLIASGGEGMAAPLGEAAFGGPAVEEDAPAPRWTGATADSAGRSSGGGAAEPFELARKATERDYAAAAALLPRVRGALPARLLSAASWMEVAKASLAGARADLAVDSLRRAVAIAPDGPHAPQALLQAARILDEQLGDRAASDEVLRELVARHPDSREARFASLRLAGR
jgi:tetratricopeptide (TPR) repeat protein